MKKIALGTVIAIALGIAWYGLSPLLVKKAVNDPLPSEASRTVESESAVMLPEKESAMTSRVPVVPTALHPASGFVRIAKDGTARYLRYEDYKTINGPDVRVYLSADLEAKDFIDLGPLKGTEGNINYEIPAGTDLAKYRYALTWCEDFSVLFNSAELAL